MVSSQRQRAILCIMLMLALTWVAPPRVQAQDPIGNWQFSLSPVGRRGESLDLKITVDWLQIKNYIGDPGFLEDNAGELLFTVFVVREMGDQLSAKLVFPGKDAIKIRVGDVISLEDFSIVVNGVRPSENVHVFFWAVDSDKLSKADSRAANLVSEVMLKALEEKVGSLASLTAPASTAIKAALKSGGKLLGFVAGIIGSVLADELLEALQEEDELGNLYVALAPSSGWYVNQTLKGTNFDGNLTLQFGVTNNQSECVYNAETCAPFVGSQPAPSAGQPQTPSPASNQPALPSPNPVTGSDDVSSGTGTTDSSTSALPGTSSAGSASVAISPPASSLGGTVIEPEVLPATGGRVVSFRFPQIRKE